MADCSKIFIAAGVGYLMSLCSFLLGIKVACNIVKGNGRLFSPPPDPVGDAFTIETPEDMALFPDEIKNEAEEHILKKTNKFLERLNAVSEGK